jgi:hypothetical protein
MNKQRRALLWMQQVKISSGDYAVAKGCFDVPVKLLRFAATCGHLEVSHESSSCLPRKGFEKLIGFELSLTIS